MKNSSSMITLFLPLLVFFFILWFFLIRPQKKKDKETRDMRNSLEVGDEIVTIGGICGKVLSVKEESIVVYVGGSKTKIEFKKWAVAENISAKNRSAKKSEESKEEAKPVKRLKKKEEKVSVSEAAEAEAVTEAEETASAEAEIPAEEAEE